MTVLVCVMVEAGSVTVEAGNVKVKAGKVTVKPVVTASVLVMETLCSWQVEVVAVLGVIEDDGDGKLVVMLMQLQALK